MDEAATRSSRGPFNMVGEDRGYWKWFGDAMVYAGVVGPAQV